jgi:hypothetical protein
MPPSARPSNPSALPREDVLAAQASSARQQALERLLAQRTARGNWLAPTDPYAFPNALYVIFLRTTGLGERPLSARTEVRLIRAMLRQANSDGGFYKFVGSPSSRSLTRVAILALRLSLGEIEPGTRPPAWFRRNPLIDAGLEERVREVVARGEGFLRRSRRRKDAGYELDHRMLADLAVAHADASQPVPRLPPLSPEVMVLAIRSRWSAGAARHFGHLLRSLLPACSILATKAQERARGRCGAPSDHGGCAWDIVVKPCGASRATSANVRINAAGGCSTRSTRCWTSWRWLRLAPTSMTQWSDVLGRTCSEASSPPVMGRHSST